jgi:hypothetical protein
MKVDDNTKITNEEMERFGLYIDSDGVPREHQPGRVERIYTLGPEEAPKATTEKDKAEAIAQLSSIAAGIIEKEQAASSTIPAAQEEEMPPRAPTEDSMSPLTDLPTTDDEEYEGAMDTAAGVEEDTGGEHGGAVPTIEGLVRKRARPSYPESETEEEEEEEEEEEREEGANKRQKRCTCSGTSLGLLVRITTTKKQSNMVLRGILDDMARQKEEGHRLCFKHAKTLAGKLALKTKGLTNNGLIERMCKIQADFQHLGDLKTDDKTYHWFRVSGRPRRLEDGLGPYKFHHKLPDEFAFDPRAALANIGYEKLYDRFQKDGTITANCFAWWFEKGSPIGDIVREEFDMYKHHLRMINEKDNMGWLRNAYYSLAQQLMRQDPMYYMLYVCLRPDNHWRLISYPYYAKYAVEGDNTFFRHIDVNLKQLVEDDRGIHQLQGSVTIDNENKDNCTELVKGMHHYSKEWYERLTARGEKMEGLVNRVTPKIFNEDDAKYFKTKWSTVICKAGDARITFPQLPHGSTGPATQVRRTMLPWFVGIQDDHEEREIVEGGTYSMLAKAHKDMCSPLATPSGLPNRYGKIPYAFPAATQLNRLGPLSDALVGRIRWDDPATDVNKNTLLRGDKDEVQEYLSFWRARATKRVEHAWKLVQHAEQRAFGERSYFACKEGGTDTSTLIADSPGPELESLGGSDIEADVSFAEEGETVIE